MSATVSVYSAHEPLTWLYAKLAQPVRERQWEAHVGTSWRPFRVERVKDGWVLRRVEGTRPDVPQIDEVGRVDGMKL